ncbi:MAG: DUF4258 domain-containing protein [Chloroflexi bacterium]|nr:DUF4258 domain-containing protein [Chloroflexota bacterium]
METFANPIPGIQNAKHNSELLYNAHALRKMIERHLQLEHVKQALNFQEVEMLENYPQVGRPSPECLILGRDETGRVLHILAAYPLAEVITVYEPTPPKWINPRERGKQ